jgi:autotransporter-associated beta strand protein
LIKSGAGVLALGCSNTFTGGTEINSGTLTLYSTNNLPMQYVINGGMLKCSIAYPGSSLAMTSAAFGAGSPQVTIDYGTLPGSVAPAIDDTGVLSMNGNVTVNVTNLNLSSTGVAVLLRYAGARSGPGSFLAGFVPSGLTLLDDAPHHQVIVYQPGPRVVLPGLNTNEIIVAAATPQEYGAYGDGVTDDSAAFQNAINAVYNSGGPGGGVIYVPAANYAFYNNIIIPTGVTLHGNWTDWTTGSNGLAGTTFSVYVGAGQSNGTPFITMGGSTALRDVNIWYPNQNPANIASYPFTILVGGDDVVQNVVLVNSYQGIQVGSAEFILSTIIGTPLYMGFSTTGTIADISQTEDIRFSPAVWPASLLPNAPEAGGPYATWMRKYGTGMQLFRLDGLINNNTEISGYNVGLDFEENSGGNSGCAFYNGWVTNCAVAVLAQEMQSAAGLEFSCLTLDGDMAVSRTHLTNGAAAQFENCQIIGRNGTAVSCTGSSWQSAMAFQNCTISNALDLAGPGVFNLVDCRLSGATQCVISASATRVALTGCAFTSPTNIVNKGNGSTNLIIYGGASISNAIPRVNWTNILNDYATRLPARTNLFLATSYGATGNGSTDDTAAIQRALSAAGANGGGLVYLPPGMYHLTNTLDVPVGVELRGPYETRHSPQPGNDGIAKGAILQPYEGQGTTNGPPAVALEKDAGLKGVTISYESQWSNCFAFPPAIQGRGANVYVIGVQCPNPYYYVDLDTYTCTNHFIDMVDGWALQTGVHVGNGSSGSIIDCHANWTFWINNSDSSSHLQGAAETPVESFAMSNLQYYVLGNCTELFVKDFSIIENMYMHCSAENNLGPNVTAISAMCDATYQCFVFDSTAPCTFSDINPEWLVSLNGGYPGLTNQAALISTTDFQGTVRFFNSPMWGSHNHEYIVNGGDIGFELVHLWQYAFEGSEINGGSFHLINCGAFNVVDGGSGSPPYNLTFGPASGLPNRTNEVIGCFSYSGWNIKNDNITNPANIWTDYALSNHLVLNVGPLVVGDIYPDGLYQFEPSPALTFMAYSPNGINSNAITLQLAATNLLGQGYVTNLNVADGLAVNGSSTTKSVAAPLATNALYSVVIQVADQSGNRTTNTLSFDTITPAYTFEAEDFDYNGGDYISNPQPDAYDGLTGMAGIDYSNGIPGQGSASYRPQGLETEGAGDIPRLAYSGLQDYDIGFANKGNWGNYTRALPSGTFYLFMRAATPNGAINDIASMYSVTSGQGGTGQTTLKLGAYSIPNTGGWQSYTWIPLKVNTSTFTILTGGSVETLRATTDNTGYNVNFYMLVTTNIQPPWLVSPLAQSNAPVPLSASLPSGGQFVISWPTNGGAGLAAYYSPSLLPGAAWSPLTNTPTVSNGQWILVLPVGTNTSGFYRLQ